MSGGHFNDDGYIYYSVDNFADQLELEIEKNNILNDYNYAPNFNSEVINYLKDSIAKIRRVAKLMRHIDYLYSGDYGEECFLKRVREVESERSDGQQK